MESAPSLETVFQALHALYHNPDVTGKEKASIWLGELQKSVYAWQISDQLLQLNQDIESCYFAAQTMRTKIQYAFHELPLTSHDSLKDSLMNHVSKITQDTPPVIATQLCLALVDLALQMVTWKNSAQDMIQRFASDVKNLHFLVELLTVLPEEISSHSLRLGDNRRKEVTSELTQASPLVIQLLTACLENSGEDVRLQAKVFRCMGSWFSISAIPQENIVNTSLFMAPFQALTNPDCLSHVHEAASDCVCSALYAAELRDQGDIQAKSVLALGLFQGVLSLPDAYHMSVATEDIDKSINYCRIFTEMAESFLDMIVTSPNQAFGDFRTLELLLTCIGHHQYEVADITFNFWYRLSESLYQRNNQQLNDLLRPYIQRLIVALCQHCRLDPDHEDIPSDIDGFRARVSELIKDVVFIVGSSTCFSQMFESLKNQSSDSSWDASEAALFVMAAVAKNILPKEKEIVPQVLQAVLGLQDTTHIALRYTSTILVGELCEWIQQNPQYLDPVLQFLLQGLQQPKLATATAGALQSICSKCQDNMINHFPGLLQIAQAMESFNISNDAILGLLKGTAMVLAQMPHEKITDGLRELCNLQTQPLTKVLEAYIPNPAVKTLVGSPEDPSVWLDRLAAIFRYTNPTVTNGEAHPCQSVIMEVWPVLSLTCDKYRADVRVIERCCRCIRFAVRCLGKGSATLLTPLVTQMVGLYEDYQHSCFLYLGSILVDEYGTEAGCIQGLIDMLQAFCSPTFKVLEVSNGLRDHPDTVDDLFRLCLRFTQRAPLSFLQSSMIKPILCCAIASCALDHQDANASVTKFLTEFIKQAREKEEIEGFEAGRVVIRALLEEHGAAMTAAVLNACLFSLSSFMLPDTAEIIYQLMLIDRMAMCKWLEVALKDLPSQNSAGANNATQKQLTDFHKTITSAEECKQVCRSMREFARLYR